MNRATVSLGFLLAAGLMTAWADEGDPPSRVARLNYLNGPVSFRPGSVEDWTEATLNYPLTIGDHLWADTGARTELHVGSTAIRMDSQTALSILNLDDRAVQLSVTEGSVNVHIRYLDPSESFEVDTPNAAISLLRVGDYRISADSDNGVTTVVVNTGEAEVTAGGGAFPVRATESARLTGMDTVSQELGPAPRSDGFDQFCTTRERREMSSVSARYVPRDMIGYEDLDQYGVWRDVPGYGPVWSPTGVPVGWAPYHYGHWAWVDPWGWTWIDDAPWGFAPFHYGRWAFVGGGWFWVPGRMVVGVRPVYAPALVAFVGGPRFGVAVGLGGGVGVAAWFPLGPGEVYRPAYHTSPVYVQNVNIVHVTNVTVINNVNVTNVRYVNREVAGAVTVVPQGAFAGSRPVAAAAIAVPRGAMMQGEVVGYTPGVAPTREAVLARAGGPVRVNAPPARYAERPVVARMAPPPPPVSFAAREQALRANGGRPLDPAQMNTYRQNAPARNPMVRAAGPAGGQAPGGMPNAGRPEMVRPGPAGAPAGTPAGAAPGGAPQPSGQGGFRNDRPGGNQPRTFGQPQNNEQPQNAPQRTFGRPQNNEQQPPPQNTQAPRTFGRPQTNEQPQNTQQQPPRTFAQPQNAPAPRNAEPPRGPENRPAAETARPERNNDRPAGRGQQKKEREGRNPEKQ
jgi:hypothetical protein